MLLSRLIFALTLIVYGAIQLGADAVSIKLVWWGLVVGGVLWIVESLFWQYSVPRVKRGE